MAHGFVRVDRDQQFLLPPDLRSWLPSDHEVWFVIDLVEQLDLSALEASYRLGRQGRAPVSPTMLLTLFGHTPVGRTPDIGGVHVHFKEASAREAVEVPTRVPS